MKPIKHKTIMIIKEGDMVPMAAVLVQVIIYGEKDIRVIYEVPLEIKD